MKRFFTKKLILTLSAIFLLSVLTMPTHADWEDDAEDVEDKQNVSNILMIAGVTLVVVAIIIGIARSGGESKKAEKTLQEEERKANEALSDSLNQAQPQVQPEEDD